MEHEPTPQPTDAGRLYRKLADILEDAPLSVDKFWTEQRVMPLTGDEVAAVADVFSRHQLDVPEEIELGLYLEAPFTNAENEVVPGPNSALIALTSGHIRTIYSVWVEAGQDVELMKTIEAVEPQAADRNKTAQYGQDATQKLLNHVTARGLEESAGMHEVTATEVDALTELLDALQ